MSGVGDMHCKLIFLVDYIFSSINKKYVLVKSKILFSVVHTLTPNVDFILILVGFHAINVMEKKNQRRYK